MNRKITVISNYRRIHTSKMLLYKIMAFLVCYCCVGQSVFKIKTDTPNDPHRNFIFSLYWICTYLTISLGRKSKN